MEAVRLPVYGDNSGAALRGILITRWEQRYLGAAEGGERQAGTSRHGIDARLGVRVTSAQRSGAFHDGRKRNSLAKCVYVISGLPMMHVLDALGNPVRRSILRELRDGPRPVGEIAAGMPISRPAVSRHLRVLEEAGLVQAREEGSRNLYSIRMQGFASVREFVDDFWDAALARIEELARR